MFSERSGAYNSETTCRCCLRDCARLAPLNKPAGIIDAPTIGDALKELADVQFSPNDDLPQKVCRKCIVALGPAFAFRKMCQANDAKLREFFEKQTTNSVCAYEVHFVDVNGFKVESNSEPNFDTDLVPKIEQTLHQKMNSEVAVGDIEHNVQPDEILENISVENTHTNSGNSARLGCLESEVCSEPVSISEISSTPATKPSPESIGKLKLYNCKICSRRRNYTSLATYEKHMATHKKAKPFSCDICKRHFTSKRNLSCHMESHQPDTYRQLCSLCGKKFLNSVKLNEHMMYAHTGERPFKCDVCDKTFHRSHCLTVHKLIHLAVKPHGCPYCGKTFVNTGKLDRHVRIHTGERPFVCAHCGKSFYADTNYKNHVRIHTGERPYRCNICGEMFSQSQQLLNHRRKFDHFEPTAARSQT